MRLSLRIKAAGAVITLVLAGTVISAGDATAETLAEALARAYTNNPTLRAARSTGRAIDESVPIALSGYRPTINGSLSVGASDAYSVAYPSMKETHRHLLPESMSLSIVQPLFTGFRSENGVKQSEASVRAQREILRDTEQTVLLQAVTAFGDVIRDTALWQLAQNNVAFLTEQRRGDADRLSIGQGTRTDVARSEAQLQQGLAQLSSAKSQLTLSQATYHQVVGTDPKSLSHADLQTLAPLLPRSAEAGIKTALAEHPAIQASLHNRDVAAFNVKILEGALLPQLNAQGQASYNEQPSTSYDRTSSASVSLNLTVPLYQGGAEYAKVRQAKEQLDTARLQTDANRDQVRARVTSYWGQLDAARASVVAAKAQIDAAELTLTGVQEEWRVGQKTNVDVLDAQTAVVNAKSTLATAERNRLVASFALLAAVGRLDATHLKLKVSLYRPEEHYGAVRDKWFGLRTPDGR
jgi:outer membrane protein